MSKDPKRLKADSAYRIKRARRKKPMRLVELGIVVLFLIIAAYVASSMVQITKGYSQERTAVEYFVNLQILNGCGQAGVAGLITEQLEKTIRKPLTVRVVDAANFDNFNVDTTFIISRKADTTAAKLLARQLGLDEDIAYRELEDNYMDIGATLVVGKDYHRLLTGQPSGTPAGNPKSRSM
jgi:hypothetical protein